MCTLALTVGISQTDVGSTVEWDGSGERIRSEHKTAGTTSVDGDGWTVIKRKYSGRNMTSADQEPKEESRTNCTEERVIKHSDRYEVTKSRNTATPHTLKIIPS
jgi:hypothetical protein